MSLQLTTNDCQPTAALASGQIDLRERLREAVTRLVTQFHDWRRAVRDREALSRMDDHQLRDIGLERSDVEGLAPPLWTQPGPGR